MIRYFEYSNYTLNRKSIFLTEYIPGTLVHQSVLFLHVHLAFPVLEKWVNKKNNKNINNNLTGVHQQSHLVTTLLIISSIGLSP